MAWALVAVHHQGAGGEGGLPPSLRVSLACCGCRASPALHPLGPWGVALRPPHQRGGADKLCLINDNQPKIKYRYN